MIILVLQVSDQPYQHIPLTKLPQDATEPATPDQNQAVMQLVTPEPPVKSLSMRFLEAGVIDIPVHVHYLLPGTP